LLFLANEEDKKPQVADNRHLVADPIKIIYIGYKNSSGLKRWDSLRRPLCFNPDLNPMQTFT
jgi:hypothetical protein